MNSSQANEDPVAQTAPPTLTEQINQNIETIVTAQKRQWETIPSSQRWVERIGKLLGRPAYLLVLVVAIGFWISINIGGWYRSAWDPPPFELLDGIMTLISLITTTIVLVAQNRQTKREQQHTQLTLQVALITEQKVTKLINLIEELRRDMPMVRDRHDPHAEALQESADTAKVLQALDEDTTGT